MGNSVLYMSMSLDGFVAGPNESWEDNPLGDDGWPSRVPRTSVCSVRERWVVAERFV
jgi:hypothetical protein